MVSLLALVLAIGIVVDDAIVVVEAVEANLEADHSLSPSDAAKRAMGQITAPILAITMVLLSVFVPVAFIPGISGQLYQQFAVAVAVSMVISAINALTLSPALCAVLLRHHAGPKHRTDPLCAGRDRLRARRLRRHRQALGACRVLEPGRGRRLPCAQCLAVQGHPRRLPAVGGPGRLLRRGAAARGRLGQPHRHRRRAGREAAQGHPGRRRHQHGRRLQHAGRAQQIQQRLLHRAPQAVRRADRRRARTWARSSPRCAPQGAGDPRGQHHPVQRAADHRPGDQRRLRVPVARPAGRRSRRPRRRGARR